MAVIAGVHTSRVKLVGMGTRWERPIVATVFKFGTKFKSIRTSGVVMIAVGNFRRQSAICWQTEKCEQSFSYLAPYSSNRRTSIPDFKNLQGKEVLPLAVLTLNELKSLKYIFYRKVFFDDFTQSN